MLTSEQSAAPADIRIGHMHIRHSVYYAVIEPAGTHPKPPALLIAAHGYGQSCKGFIRNFAPLADRNYLIVAPQGPNQFYWQETGKVGFTWMTRHGRENSIPDLMDYMAQLMERIEGEYTFDRDRVFSLGFSQGTALAFRFGASGIVAPRGVIACGGDLPPDVAERLDSLTRFPAMIVHGRDDTTMSFAKAEEGVATLRAHGYDTTTHYFDGGHDIGPDQVQEIAAWMERQ